MVKETGGTWFAAYGCVYSQLDDETVVRVSLMDREESGTYGAERDANAKYIARLQNEDVGWPLTEKDLILALEQIG